ncbi:MAG TPA: tetratricopeptide repeat protein, partial [Phycisphaerae bacterium]|nr:tetratricopeptide repeat protein [Phycisphaerae bacterium]
PAWDKLRDDPRFDDLLRRMGLKGVTAALAVPPSAATQPGGAGPPRPASSKIASLAVLPLRNISGDPAQEPFADEMTEALSTALGQISALDVRSSHSTLQFKGSSKPISEIAGALNVDGCLEGSVQRSPERVVVQVRLIHAATERQLWAKRYERPLTDVLILESELARAVADEIQVKLTPQEQRQLTKARAVDPAAHEAYVLGRHYWNKRTEEGLRKSIAYFEQAIERDPNYALAYVGLADTYSTLPSWSYMPNREGYPKAKEFALKALAIEPSLGEAHIALASVLHDYEWDFANAEKEFRRGLELAPNYATGRQWYAQHLHAMGRHREAFAQIEEAVRLDPWSPIITVIRGDGYYYLRQYDQAIPHYLHALELDPHFPVYICLARTYGLADRAQLAISEYEADLRDRYGATTEQLTTYRRAHASGGLPAARRWYVAFLEQRRPRGGVDPTDIAAEYAALGDADRAFQWLDRAYQQRCGELLFVSVNPMFDPLRSDPRFDDLLRRIGLPTGRAGFTRREGPAGKTRPTPRSPTTQAPLKSSAAPTTAPTKIMLAVLPLENLSRDPEQEYFSDGLTEELIDRLGQIEPGHLSITGRTSAMYYKGKNVKIDQIGRELGVQYVLEGTVRTAGPPGQAGTQLHITARLVQVSDQSRVWSQSYDRTLADVFAVQAEVGQSVAQALALELVPQRRAQLTKVPTTNSAAYDLYLRGRSFWNRRTEADFYKAIDFFRQAIQQDSRYAPAYVGLADTYALLAGFTLVSTDEGLSNAKPAAEKALELDDSLAEAHAALGHIRHDLEWDWQGAEREYRRAIQLDPGYATAHHWYAGLLADLGRADEALAEQKRARELEPLSLIIRASLAYYSTRDYDRQIEACRDVLAIDPRFEVAQGQLGLAYAQKGDYEQARAAMERTVSLSGRAPGHLADLGYVYAKAGMLPEARAILDELRALSERKYVAPSDFALIHAALGEKDEAFAWLEQTFAQHDSYLTGVNADPRWDTLRDDPRFDDLLRRMGLKGTSTAPAVPVTPTTQPLLKSSGTQPSSAGPLRPASSKIASLAVLPLENRSGDPEQEYFADGMTEALIGDLGRISALERVISFHSAAQFKGTRKPLPQIGRELKVDGLLEGSVQRSPERILIRVQLIHAASDKVVWSKSFDKEPRDVLAFQGEIARAVAQEIQAKLTPQEQKQLAKVRPVDPEAHELYLKGRYFWNKRTEEALKKSIMYFQQAIDKDPGYALAYSGLGDAYSVLGGWEYVPSKEAYEKTKAAALKAQELDDMLAEAHATGAGDIYGYEWNWEGAEREFKRAIQLNPGYASAHQWYGIALSIMGHHEEAIAELERARELDPLSAIIGTTLGEALISARQYDRAIQEFRKALELDASLPSRGALGKCYEATGRPDEAMQEYAEGFRTRFGATPEQVTAYRQAYSAGGMAGARRWYVAFLETEAARRRTLTYEIASQYASLGEADRAFEWLERAYEGHDQWLTSLVIDAEWDGLRGEPRYERMWRKIGLWKEHPRLPTTKPSAADVPADGGRALPCDQSEPQARASKRWRVKPARPRRLESEGPSRSEAA